MKEKEVYIKQKIQYDTIQRILQELRRVPNIERDETIKGKYTFEQFPNFPNSSGDQPFILNGNRVINDISELDFLDDKNTNFGPGIFGLYIINGFKDNYNFILSIHPIGYDEESINEVMQVLTFVNGTSYYRIGHVNAGIPEWTEFLIMNLRQEYLGVITDETSAPTPHRNGYYKFAIERDVLWLTGNPHVYPGDELYIAYNSSTSQHQYNYIRITDRISKSVTDVLETNSDGIKTHYSLSDYPVDSNTLFVFINGLLREDIILAGKDIILPFVPVEGSRIIAKYFTTLPVADYAADYYKITLLMSFFNAFVITNKILMHDGELVTHNGEYIEVDINV